MLSERKKMIAPDKIFRELVPPFRFAHVCCAVESCNQSKGDPSQLAGAEDFDNLATKGEPSKVEEEEPSAGDDTELRTETLFRGGYPSLCNFAFLKSLRLKTVVSFLKGGRKGLTLDLFEFCQNENITLVLVDLGEESKVPNSQSLKEVISLLIRRDKLPAYVHCNDGGVSTGICIMCIRLLQKWSLESATSEYCRYVKDGSVSSEVRNLVSSFSLESVEIPEKESKASWLQ